MATATAAKRNSKADLRKGYHAVTPYIIAAQGPALVDFVKQAFGAQELHRSTGSAGGIHCEVLLGDSKLLLGGGQPGVPWKSSSHAAAVHLYVEDVDGTYRRALKAGARSVREPVHQPYGDYEADVVDRWGNEWYIARHEATGEKRPGFRTATTYLHPKGAEKLLEFVERAFGAERIEVHRSPEGAILHGTVRVGDSLVEFSEAHVERQPLATALFYIAGDPDESYRRALQAGATSLYEPKDMSYGMRSAGVLDPSGHTWYLQGMKTKAKKRTAKK